MTRHQRITSIFVFAALVAAAIPGTAAASSLLSGYGGPGEGNQAILGSALLNTPKGGGGGTSGGGGLGQAAAASAQSGEAAGTQSAQGSSSGAKSSTGHHGKGARATKTATRDATSQAAPRGSVIYPAASREEAAGGSRALGLSGIDLVYIILAVGVLAFTGFLTIRLGRTATTHEPDGTRS